MRTLGLVGILAGFGIFLANHLAGAIVGLGGIVVTVAGVRAARNEEAAKALARKISGWCR
jgi:hypothetical protein